MGIPFAVVCLFAAPVSALLFGYFFLLKRKPEWMHWPMILSCAVVGAAAASIAAQVYSGHIIDVSPFKWMPLSSWSISFGFRLDGLSAVMLCLVSLVGGLIHVYAGGYMENDPAFGRFFLAFHLFYLSMIGLVVANNYVQMYLFWEMVGLSSYLLIGFWYQKASARRASLQAFFTNRVGDIGFFLALLILMNVFPAAHTRFVELFPLLGKGSPAISWVGWFLFLAAIAKSAQFPLYFWLPDAMEGPTPVSALMHAATMVTAGIFLMARSWPLMSLVPHLPNTIAAVGAFTAVFSGIIAATRKDLKRILAYSTVSHLGIMTFGLGLGEVSSAVFHLVTHGFFKAALFLCAGNIAHALHKSTASVDETGGLLKKIPVTAVFFTVAAFSLSGIWPFAGFYSKDAILGAAFDRGGWAGAAGFAIAFLSAFYIFRMLFLAFLGPRKEQNPPEHPHEAGPMMNAPLFFIVLGALGIGWFGTEFYKLVSSGWLGASPMVKIPGFDWASFTRSTSMAGLGILAAYLWTMQWPSFDWVWRKNVPLVEKGFDADFGVKPMVAALTLLVEELSYLLGVLWDKKTWDGWIESMSAWAEDAAKSVSSLASGRLNDSLWWILLGGGVMLLRLLK